MLNVLLAVAVTNAPVNRRTPIPLDADTASGRGQRVRRRQSANISITRGGRIAIESEQQKIGDGGMIQLTGNIGVSSQAIERIAENKLTRKINVVEGLDAEVIASAEECVFSRVPNRKREIAPQMRDAIPAPQGIRMEDQLGICDGPCELVSAGFDRGTQFGAGVEAHVRRNGEAAVQCRGLVLVGRFTRGAQQSV